MITPIMPDLSTAVAESCLSFTDPSKKSDSNPLTEILKCPTKVVLLRVRIRPGAFLPASLGRNSLALTMGYDSFRLSASYLALYYTSRITRGPASIRDPLPCPPFPPTATNLFLAHSTHSMGSGLPHGAPLLPALSDANPGFLHPLESLWPPPLLFFLLWMDSFWLLLMKVSVFLLCCGRNSHYCCYWG